MIDESERDHVVALIGAQGSGGRKGAGRAA